MYRSLTQATADGHRYELRDEAARTRLTALASCCAQGWDRARQRVTAWLRDVVRTTQLGAGYQPPLQQQPERGYFQPCCA